MAIDLTEVTSNAGLTSLDKHMLEHSYVEGFQPSKLDAVAFASLAACPDPSQFPSVARWWQHIASFTREERNAWGSEAEVPPKIGKSEEAEDEVDLFGDDDEEDEKDLAAVMAEKAAAKKAAEEAKKEKKKAPIGKSTVTLEIRATSADVDLDELALKIKALEIEGLQWTQQWEQKKLYYGLSALIMGCIIVDDLVPLETIERSIMCVGISPEMAAARNEAMDMGVEFDEEDDCIVKSCSVMSFVKL